MSSRELAKSMIDLIPESRLFYVIAYLQGAAVPDDRPNAETAVAFEELENGGGFVFKGSTADLFAELARD